MSNSICNSVHNVAFITAGYVSRTDIMFAIFGFVAGMATGISICSMM